MLGLLASWILSASPAAAQAWVPPAHVGAVSVSFQTIDNTGHRGSDGTQIDGGKSVDASFYVEGEYAFTNRLSVSAGIPLVFAKYIGPDTGPPNFPFLPVDSCFCWHSAWQDFGSTVRYNLANGAFALTPSISVGIPSHDYAFQGESVPGRNLKELRLALDAGRRLDLISPKLSVQARYSYAVVEHVLDVPNNRSHASVEGAFAFTRRLSARGLVSWQHTHGGVHIDDLVAERFAELKAIAAGGGIDPQVAEHYLQLRNNHDRLLQDNNWHVGAGVSFSLARVDLFGSYVEYVKGTDSHMGRVFTTGISWPFELGTRPALLRHE
jgi:hypothetical protein